MDATLKTTVASTVTKKVVNNEVYWLSHVFYKSAYFVLLVSWIYYIIASANRLKYRYLGKLLGTGNLSNVDYESPHPEDDAGHPLYPSLLEREMRDIATSFLLVTIFLKFWPESIQEVDVPVHSGVYLKEYYILPLSSLLWKIWIPGSLALYVASQQDWAHLHKANLANNRHKHVQHSSRHWEDEIINVTSRSICVPFRLSSHGVELITVLCSVIQRRNRVAQTTGPYLKRFRQGLRHLEDVSDKLKTDKGKVTRRWKKVYFKYAMAERMLLCDIRSKEKLIGYLRTKMQCSLVALKDVTSSVKVSRDRLELQRQENKLIIDQLEYFTQIAQNRQQIT